MEIRPATTNDVEHICLLAEQINIQHYNGAPHIFKKPTGIARDRAFWSEHIIKEKAVFLVATVNNCVIGFITASITENKTITFLKPKIICRIGTVVVEEQFQKKGIGRDLMSKIEEWSVSKGVNEIRLEVMEFNILGQQFYDSIGFVNSSRVMAKQIS